MSEERHIRSCPFPAAPFLAKSAFQTWIQLRWKQKRLFLVWSIYKGSFRRTQSWHFTIHIPVICHTIASWHSYGLIMTFECIKNTSGKANNFKNQILPMWSYNVNCWAGSTSAAFLSAIASASPAAKVEDKTNIQGSGFLLVTSSRSWQHHACRKWCYWFSCVPLFLQKPWSPSNTNSLCLTERVCAFLRANGKDSVYNRYERKEYCRIVRAFGSFYSKFLIYSTFAEREALTLPAPRGNRHQQRTHSPLLCSLHKKRSQSHRLQLICKSCFTLWLQPYIY